MTNYVCFSRWVSEKSQRKAALKELEELTKRGGKIFLSYYYKFHSAEGIKTARTTRNNSLGSECEMSLELKVPDGRRRANSLVTELMTDQARPSHLSRLELLRMESCGNIIGQSQPQSDSSLRMSRQLDITLKSCL